MRQYIQKIRFSPWSVPLALLAACILAFGLLIPFLGYYQDDWHFVYYAYARGVGKLWELSNYDGRPFAAWTYVVGFTLLGFKPLNWHIATLLLRWLTVTSLWAAFRQIWPRHARQVFIAALVFALYPFFSLQPLAVTYFQHWMAYLFFGLSVNLMLLAAKNPRRWAIFTLLALLCETIHLFTIEYFTGLELLRPLLLWLVFAGEELPLGAKIRRVAKQWLPYLLPFALFVFWRGFIYQSPVAARTVPVTMYAFLANPLQTVLSVALAAIPDFVLVLVSSWYNLLLPEQFDFTVSANRNIAALMLVVFGLAWFYFARQKDADSESDSGWNRQALLVGLASVVTGLLSSYAGGYEIYTKVAPWNSRFSMGAMFGAGLLAAVVFEFVVTTPIARRVVFALLVSLLVGWQVRNANTYRWAWAAEVDFYRQLAIRAPSIAPNTAFIATDEFLGLMGDYPTSFAINTLYSTPGGTPGNRVNYWFFAINSNFGGDAASLQKGILLQGGKHSMTFEGKSTDSLVLTFEPDLGQCLWIIRPEDAANRLVSPLLQQDSPLTDLRRIRPQPVSRPFMDIILGDVPRSWCTYYQQAELARQQQNWRKAAALWNEASRQGFKPANGFEYLPFIEASGQTLEWTQALSLTRLSNKSTQGMQDTLCALWKRLEQQTAASAARAGALQTAQTYLGCQP